ncbi:hypothetical protein BI364_07275 [Acidihalobacter yilgarnensis]|uniref:Uncharacterized protein n=1 Tax=Acidihalobacter yilgarnensis TaxID=2819280 RepID=A0A1D8IMZ4_9GAMM|nr:hypothetical protein [Acidihalobacter yilgarnensis]AOU97791.1 hypothetical protein BI364_07275 [Acidihalobacter yilgarnensis]
MRVLHKHQDDSLPDLFADAGMLLLGSGDEYFDWDEKAVHIVRTRLLETSMRDLADPRNGTSTFEDILDWMGLDSGNPFSFRRCVEEYAREFGMDTLEAMESIKEEARNSYLRTIGRLYERTTEVVAGTDGISSCSDRRESCREVA